MDFPGISGKASTANAGDTRDASSIPGLGRSPGVGNSSPLHYSCLENPRDRGTWWATVQRVTKNWTQLKWLSTHARIYMCVCMCVCVCVYISSVQLVAQSCLTLCNPIDCSTPGLPVHHQLPEPAHTHVHRVGDAIQPYHPLSSPSPPAFNLSQHQGLIQWVSSSRQVAKVLELQHQSCQWIFRTDFL